MTNKDNSNQPNTSVAPETFFPGTISLQALSQIKTALDGLKAHPEIPNSIKQNIETITPPNFREGNIAVTQDVINQLHIIHEDAKAQLGEINTHVVELGGVLNAIETYQPAFAKRPDDMIR